MNYTRVYYHPLYSTRTVAGYTVGDLLITLDKKAVSEQLNVPLYTEGLFPQGEINY